MIMRKQESKIIELVGEIRQTLVCKLDVRQYNAIYVRRRKKVIDWMYKRNFGISILSRKIENKYFSTEKLITGNVKYIEIFRSEGNSLKCGKQIAAVITFSK